MTNHETIVKQQTNSETSEKQQANNQLQQVGDKYSAQADKSTDLNNHSKSSTKANKKSFKRFFKSKKFIIPLLIILLAIITIFSLPKSRYAILSKFINKNYTFQIYNKTTDQPIAYAIISIDNQNYSTDNQGYATIQLPVGSYNLTVTKKYYAGYSNSIFVGLGNNKTDQIGLTATGELLNYKISNLLSGSAINGAQLVILNSQSSTNQAGVGNIVVPINTNSSSTMHFSAQISAPNYLPKTVSFSLKPNQTPSQLNFSLTPSGKVYFLSNQFNATYNIVSANLDGSNLTPIYNLGSNYSSYNISLTPSNDNQYLAVTGLDNNNNFNLIIYNTKNNTADTIIKDNPLTIVIIGWTTTNNLIYELEPSSGVLNSNSDYSLLSYNPANGQSKTLFSSQFASYLSNNQTVNGLTSLSGAFLLNNNNLIADISWEQTNQPNPASSGNLLIPTNTVGIVEFNLNNPNNPTVLWNESENNYSGGYSLQLNLVGPNQLDIQATNSSNLKSYYTVTNSKFNTISQSQYATDTNNLVTTNNNLSYSPNDQYYISIENINNHNQFNQVNIASGTSNKIGLLSNSYQVYEYVGNNYLVLSKNNNQLYAMAIIPGNNNPKLVSIANYLY